MQQEIRKLELDKEAKDLQLAIQQSKAVEEERRKLLN